MSHAATSDSATSTDLASIRRRLEAVGQQHLLNFHDRLPPPARRALLDQIASLEIESLPSLVRDYVLNKPAFSLPADVRPAPYYPYDAASPSRRWDRPAMRAVGEELIRAGQVAAFVVAGGQGSRLGYEGPKGCYPAGSVTDRPLFALFADQLDATRRAYGRAIPWYIMTSPLNHEATVAFFREHSYFGLDPADVMFFPQGVMPSLDIATGKVLLAGPGEVATNPDGHGGAIKAICVSGALADMKRRGVRHLSYFQVDNATVRVVDPVFIGLHAAAPDSSAQMSSKMIPKAYPEEKVGVFCSLNGRTEIVEYSDLPMDLQRQRDESGALRFIAGSIAIHVIAVDFIEKLGTDPSFSLPYHRAEKKVPCIDPVGGEAIAPTANNGVKLERFIFDALGLCDSGTRGSIVYETDRVEEFAPIKNATGVDSPQTSRELQTRRAARWLERAGVAVPTRDDGSPDCVLEIRAQTAMEADALIGRQIPRSIERGQSLVL
jgi:UDP-N-acetylglucosamine/UDP-N-acetylgalactosamine diphosphorylase